MICELMMQQIRERTFSKQNRTLNIHIRAMLKNHITALNFLLREIKVGQRKRLKFAMWEISSDPSSYPLSHILTTFQCTLCRQRLAIAIHDRHQLV